jgi:hypothetical protein
VGFTFSDLYPFFASNSEIERNKVKLQKCSSSLGKEQFWVHANHVKEVLKKDIENPDKTLCKHRRDCLLGIECPKRHPDRLHDRMEFLLFVLNAAVKNEYIIVPDGPEMVKNLFPKVSPIIRRTTARWILIRDPPSTPCALPPYAPTPLCSTPWGRPVTTD